MTRARQVVATVGLGLVVGLFAACAAGAPAPSSAPPAPSNPPTAVPSKVDAAANLTARFLEAIEAPDARFRAIQTTTVAAGEALVTQVITTEVVGPDAHLEINVSREGEPATTSELVVIGGDAFTRSGSGPWQASAMGADIAAVGRTFSFLEGHPLRGLGRELRGGSYVEHLELEQPLLIDQAVRDTFAMGVGDGTVQSLNLWLQPDGTPTSLEVAMAFRIPATNGGEPTNVQAVIVQEFSDFGGDIVVRVPATS